MKFQRTIFRPVFGFFVMLFIGFCIPQAIRCQTETLDGVQFTPPSGWAKTPKQGAAVFTDINKAANTFCVLTVYGMSTGSGDVKRDFADRWREFVVTPFKAEAAPRTETQPAADGWTAMAGGSIVDMNGIKSAAILTVFSGYGRTASVLAIFNDESYSAQMQAVVDSLKLDKGGVSSVPPAGVQNDPFPDRPGYARQKPLTGALKSSITMSDLAGNWDVGAGSVQTYVDSSTGNYSGTSTSFYGERYTVRPNGTFDYLFVGRANNRTVKEPESGTVELSGGHITFVFKTRSPRRFQFIAFVTEPRGASILSLVGLGEKSQGYDAAALSTQCGHGDGYIHCVGGEEWVRLGSGSVESAVSDSPAAAAPIEHWVILKEFQDNQVAAEAKYSGKRVTITGPMDMVLVENGKPVIRMGVPAWSGRQMFCIFPVTQQAAVTTLKADQRIVLECTVLGNAGGVSKIGRVDLGSSVGRLTLDNCVLK